MKKTIEWITEFESVCTDASLSTDTRMARLMLAIDNLLVDVQNAPDTHDPRDFPEPPKQVYSELYGQISNLFSNIGHYNCVMDISENISQTDVLVGDGIDDLVDIMLDLQQVKWRFENTSESDAFSHYRLLFRSHWGLHARNLQLYLHKCYW